jgi:hypothetical protein
LTRLREVSTLDDELKRLTLEVWFVLIIVSVAASTLSTLEEELERLRLDV